MKKLFLLDAMALIYRAHFAFVNSPRINSKGINTGASFGFLNTLLEILQKEKPTHLAVAFDTPHPTFRNEAFAEYKAHRQEQPEDISVNIPLVKNLLKCMNIPTLEMPGYEADDIIGTLALRFGAPDFHVYMMTSDKDYCQLVTDHVYVYRPAFMGKGPEVYTVQKVLEKFLIKDVDQVRDILGLQGDSADNIPGIPGIGEKTAQKLLAEYKTVENLIANADKLSGKLKENVINFADQGLQSKQLATIHTSVPISIEEGELGLKEPNKEALGALLDELEFRQLKSKLLGETVAAAPTKKPGTQMSLFDQTEQKAEPNKELAQGPTAHKEHVPKPLQDIYSTSHFYYTLDTPEKRKKLIEYLLIQKEFCFDTETTGTESMDAELVGMSFAYVPGEAYYVPIPADKEAATSIAQEFKQVLEHPAITKIGHNIKYDMGVLLKYGIEVQAPIFDTMVAHYLLDPETRHGMDQLSKTYLQYTPISITTLIGEKGKNQGNMRDVAVDKASEYAAEDADITLQLKHCFESMMREHDLKELAEQIENPLIPVLCRMETTGVKIDTGYLNEYSILLEKYIQESEKNIHQLAGETFNIDSPKQLGTVLFEKLQLDNKPKKTETGQYATGEEVLAKLALEHPIAQEILEYRELQKLKSTYVDALPALIHPRTGLLHTSYNQTVAATGRLSSTNPNLQNIPIRTSRGKEIRKAFVTRFADGVLMSADYSQIELRIMAAFSQDESMMEAFRRGVDIHATTAAKVYKVPLESVDDTMRRNAKMVNFGIIYGISAFGLAQRLGIPRKEAADIIDAYWKEFPAVKTYMDRCISTAREKEYVSTLLGRRRYLRDINSRNMTVRGFAERNAINAPIQGSAADIIKKAMIDIDAWMIREKLQSKMILQVHDELVFDVKNEELEHLKTHVEKFMKHAIELEVPMEIGMGVGHNWLEAH